MRLATWNLLHGRSLTDGEVDADRLRAAARVLDPQVVGLQEVDRDQSRSHHLDLTAEVAAALGVPDGQWRFAPALIGTPGGDWRAAGDEDLTRDGQAGYGIGLVSTYPVTSWHTLRLSAARVRSPIMIPGGGRRVMLLQDEPRVALAAVVGLPDGNPMTVATTHLSFVPGWNALQLRKITRWLGSLPAPRVLLGDLNLIGSLPAQITGWANLAPKRRTYPAPEPRFQLDHILGAGRVPEVLAATATQLEVSDHRALSVEMVTPRLR